MHHSSLVIKASQAHVKFNTKACEVIEYLFENKDLGFAVAKIDGRYPGAGRMVNKNVDIIYFVLSGSAVIHQAEGVYKIGKGDCFFLRKQSWYWIQADKLKISVASSPAWSSKQYKHEV